MKRALASILFIVVSPLLTQAAEESYSGNFWREVCKLDSPACSGFMAAIFQMHELGLMKAEASYCPPDNASVEQMKDIVMQFMEQHPEHRHVTFARLAIVALRSAYPCDPAAKYREP